MENELVVASTEKLPFSETKQRAVLGYLLVNNNFFATARHRIQPEWFIDPFVGKVYKAQVNFYDAYKRSPTVSELREEFAKGEFLKETQAVRNKLIGSIDVSILETKNFGIDVISTELTNWLQHRIYYKMVLDGTKLFNSQKLAEAVNMMQGKLKEINEIEFNNEKEVDLKAYANLFETQEKSYENACTTGLDSLDKLLLPIAKKGSLLPGDTTVLMGAVNAGKCHGENTPIMMYDGTTKMVQDILVGDELMGPDSLPRKVLSTNSGIGQLYEIQPNAGGISWTCNSAHILSLKTPNRAYLSHPRKTQKVEMALDEYLKQSKDFKYYHRLWRASLQFQEKEFAVDPYILGLWLGDGTSECASLTNTDPILIDIWKEWVTSNGDKVAVYKNVTYSARSKVFNQSVKSNIKLKSIGVIKNKHIPAEYLMSSKEQRLQLLAGIIDTDGYNDKNKRYELSTVSDRLAKDYAYLIRSLGFKASVSKSKKTIKSIGFSGLYWRINIQGNLSEIPVRVDRKRILKNDKKDPSLTGFKVIPKEIGRYYGFTLDKDGLYLLEDFTVTHNSTALITMMVANIKQRKHILYIPHEGRKEDLQEKLWCCCLGISKAELYQLYEDSKKDADKSALMDMTAKLLAKYLTFMPMMKAGLTIEEIAPIVRKYQERKRAERGDGKGYDLVVCDYPAKVSTVMAKNGLFARRHIDAYVYNYWVQLALEDPPFHALLAQQVNREASKLHQTGARLLVKEDASEAWGPVETATNIITVNRDDLSQTKNFVTYLLVKSRSSEVNWAVMCKSNYLNSIAHSEEGGCVWYKGVFSIASFADDLMAKYGTKGGGPGAIPNEIAWTLEARIRERVREE